MDDLCGSAFWDNQLSWNTSYPDLTKCFQNTVLVYIPCGFLLLFAPVDATITYYSKSRPIPWTILTISKIVLAALLCLISLLDMINTLIQYSSGELVHPADYYASVIKAASFVLVIVLVNFNRMKGIQTSGLQSFFWLLFCFGEIIIYRSTLIKTFDDDLPYSKSPSGLSFVLVTCSLPLVLAQFLLFSFADINTLVTPHDDQSQKASPEESSSFFSQLTFWWFNSLAIQGFRKPLEMQDMWTLSCKNTSQYAVNKYEKHWIPLLEKSRNSNYFDSDVCLQKPDENVKIESKARLNIIIPILKTFWWELLLAGFLKLVGSLLTFVSPLILNALISFVATNEPHWRGFFYAGILFFSSMTESIFNNQYEYRIYCVAMRVRSAITSTVYRKVLVLSSSARRKYTVGEIVNLMAVDVQRVMEYIQMVHYVWVCPLQLSVALYMLYQQLGSSMFAGLGFMLLLIPINGFVTTKIKKLQVAVMKDKDKRTKMMNEILNGIKILKLYAWEESFQERILGIRHSEIKNMKKQAYYFAVTVFSFSSASFIVALCSFTMYVLIDPDHVLDANTAFVSLSLFNILRAPFAFLPMLLTFTATFLVSLRRLNKFLSCFELDPDSISYDLSEICPIVIENGTFSWELGNEPLLKNINFSPSSGSLVAIVGTVGSGKSSLFSALLGDMEKVTGRINISGKMAYVPQQAWIQNDTLRKNILFKEQFDLQQYEEVTKSCCLTPDIEMLPGGDMTEIGEKGINLSGGQKQRVSLARAVYNNADIYLLDDPLSAVDAHVSKELFDNVIGPNGILKNKTRILVSHRINVLPEVDNIIVLSDGQISESGSYEELLQKKGAFAEFLVHYISEQSKSTSVSVNDLQLIEDIATKIGSTKLLRQISYLSCNTSSGDIVTDIEMDNPILRLSRQTSRLSVTSVAQSQRVSAEAKTPKQLSTEKDNQRLTEAEFADVGSVKLSVYMDYCKACGIISSIIFILSFGAAYSFNISSNIWLSKWSNDALVPANANNTSLRDMRLSVYGTLGASEICCMLIASIVLSVCTVKGSELIHNKSLDHILQAPMSFFDTTPIGRIINRFTKDVDTMDSVIRSNLFMFVVCCFGTVSCFIVITLQNVYFLLAVFPVILLYYIIQKVYTETSRQLKRLESVSRSPIFTHFSETVSGTSSIRAYGANNFFIQEFLERVDTNNKAYFPSIAASRWLAIRLEFFGYTISFLAALFAVLNRDTLSAGLAGLSIIYALRVTMTLNMLVRATSEIETNIVAVERCLEYTKTPKEAPRICGDFKPPERWPAEGRIKLENYSSRYREGLDLVLKDISCVINPSEKVGIVGRTGAGKSSLTQCLFRLIEAANGRIIIDGIDIANLGLYDLRSKLTIIPQDPVLFTGSLRLNLDPFSTHKDEDIWIALEQSHLKPYVTTLEKGLDYPITEGGENLSVGQRQLLCLSRALLRKTKILIMDEATAAVDMETDELIQSTIRAEFRDCTVLTIAHRLNTVMDYDRILVLQNGKIVEFDSPSALLQNKTSVFFSMAKDAELV